MKKNEKEKITKQTGFFMKAVLIFSFSFVVVYTVWTQIALKCFSITPDSVVTEKVYEFFGLEICVLMFKKVFGGFITDLGRKLGWTIQKDNEEAQDGC